MKTLKIYDLKDYDLSFPRLIRHSAKAIIIKDNKIALMHFKKENVYDFPGGGIESGETNIEALIREVKEETGLIVKPLSIKEFGKDVSICKDKNSDIICENHFYLYFCEVENVFTEPNLTEDERKNDLQFVFVDIDEAISINESHKHQEFHWVECVTYILKYIKEVFPC